MEEGLYLDNTTENEMADNATFEVDDGVAAVNDIDNNDYTEGNDNTGEVLENTENTNATVAANNGEDITKTQAFSKRLTEYSAKKVDETYASFGWVNPYTGEAITSKADYDKYRTMHESFERGQDPKIAAELSSLKQELHEYKLRDMDNQLLNNPTEKDFYETVRDDCINLVNFAKQRGVNITLNDAYNTIKAKNFHTYIANAQKKGADNAVQKINAVNQGSVGSLSTPETPKKKTVEEMSLSDINSIAERVLKGEKIKF